MNFNVIIILTLFCGIKYEVASQEIDGVSFTEWRRRIDDKKLKSFPSVLYGSLDFVDPHDDQRPRTSIVYLDSKTEPTTVKKVVKKRKRRKNKKKKGLHKTSIKKIKKVNNVMTKKENLNAPEGWRTFKQTKIGDSSGLSIEGTKHKPVDIIVHIKMKE